MGQLLAVAAQAAQTLASERLVPLGLSPRAWGLLSTLAESGPRTQIGLAAAIAADRTAMVYLVDELEQQGLVERVRNPDDRRSYLVHLTRQGRALQSRAAAELAGQTEKLLSPLNQAERKQLVALLGRIVDDWQALVESADP